VAVFSLISPSQGRKEIARQRAYKQLSIALRELPSWQHSRLFSCILSNLLEESAHCDLDELASIIELSRHVIETHEPRDPA